jgi:CheY-like chemotaxis protein
VEDSPTVRRTIRQALVLEGIPEAQVREAASGREALTVFGAQHPNVVILDITLPDVAGSPAGGAGFLDFVAGGSAPVEDGRRVARAMLSRQPDLKIVVCTGTSRDDPRVRELIQAGAFSLLEKPIRLAQLRSTLQELLVELSPHRP